MDGAEDFLRARAAHKGTFVEDDGDEGAMSDGDLQAGEEAIEEEEKMTGLLKEEDEEPEEGQRHPVPMEVRKAVEFAHRQLGHPSRSTLVRMLKVEQQKMPKGGREDGHVMSAPSGRLHDTLKRLRRV